MRIIPGLAACRAALLLLLCFSAAVYCQDYSGHGPCQSSATTLDITLPKDYQCKCQCSVRLQVFVPSGQGCTFAAPFPLVAFFSGFMATSSDYLAYAQRLSSWGFAVLQYDFLKLSPFVDSLCHTDAAEAGFLSYFLEALQSASRDPSSSLFNKLDLTRVATAGHSRGGKLAALHLAGSNPPIKTAYLIDPIDGAPFTQGKPGYPSAVDLLRGRGLRLGITGAGRIGLCNGAPFATGNWTRFHEVAGPDSWLELVVNAGHLQFVDIWSAWDALCCTGCRGLISQKEGIALTLGPLVTWMQKELRGDDVINMSPSSSPSSSPPAAAPAGGSSSTSKKPAAAKAAAAGSSKQPAAATAAAAAAAAATFREWVCRNEAAGKIQFEIKGKGEICPPGWRQTQNNNNKNVWPLLQLRTGLPSKS